MSSSTPATSNSEPISENEIVLTSSETQVEHRPIHRSRAPEPEHYVAQPVQPPPQPQIYEVAAPSAAPTAPTIVTIHTPAVVPPVPAPLSPQASIHSSASIVHPPAPAYTPQRKDIPSNPCNGKPMCPRLMSFSSQPCLIQQLSYQVECNISTAFVTITCTFENRAGEGNFLLSVPLKESSTVTSTSLRINQRIINTAVVNQDDLAALPKSEYASVNADREAAAASSRAAPAAPALNQKIMPDVFQLPVSDLRMGDCITMVMTYMEPCDFDAGKYSVSIPCYIHPSLYASSQSTLANILSVQVLINAGTPHCQWGSASHKMNCISQESERIELAMDLSHETNSQQTEFEINYFILTHEILTNLLFEPAGCDPLDPRGSFALFVSPPPAGVVQAVFGRSIVFMIDKSGSMGGSPMEDAKRAVEFGLSQLKPSDRFTIVSFDHGQEFSSQTLVQATPQAVNEAKFWLNSVRASGGTDILTPLRTCIELLKAPSQGGIPFIFCITDGAVQNEREICKMAQAEQKYGVRICTLGIGPYVNRTFLKMLSQTGRGFSDTVLSPQNIFKQMSKLLRMAEIPLLVDVQLSIDAHVETYPMPAPDLFCGAPLLLSGKFIGNFPTSIGISGRLPDGTRFEKTIFPRESKYIPVSRVFLKQRLDMLTGNAWLSGNADDVKKASDFSCQANLVCPYTSLVSYETTASKQDEHKQLQGKSGGSSRGIVVGALAVGGVLVLGGAIAANFGNVAATLSNAAVLDGMSSFFSSIDLSSIDLGGVGEAIGGCCGGMFEQIGGCVDCGAIGNCFGECGGSVFSCLGDLVKSVGDCLGSIDCAAIGDSVGGCLSGVGDCLGACADGLGSLDC